MIAFHRTEENETRGRLLLTIPDAADALSVSRRTVWRMLSAGELRAVRLGRAVRVRTADIRRIAENGGGR